MGIVEKKKGFFFCSCKHIFPQSQYDGGMAFNKKENKILHFFDVLSPKLLIILKLFQLYLC